jgi:hypothetical protein
VRPEITTDKYPAYSEYRPFSSFFVLCCVTCVALCRCKHCVPKRLVVLRGRCDSPGGNAARSGAERWFGCLGHSLDSCFLPIVELGWVDPVCGQQAVDLGFRSGRRTPWREREREQPQRCNIANPAACHRRCKFFDCRFSKVEERNCGKKSDQANGSLCCATSLRSLIIWKTNCGLHDQYKGRPVTRPNK